MSTLKTNTIQTVDGLPLLNTTGSIIQVVYGDMGSNYDQIETQNNSVIENCSVTITPTRSTSKILLIAHVVHNARYVASFGFAKNGVNIGGNTNLNSTNTIAMAYFGTGTDSAGNWCTSTTYQYQDTAGTTSPITYAPTACSSWNGAIYPLIINNRISPGANLDMTSLTSIIAMEILA
jgi:hypothetical protein